MFDWINVVCWNKQHMVANSHTKYQSVHDVFRSYNTFHYACVINIQRSEDVGPFQLKTLLVGCLSTVCMLTPLQFLYHPVYHIITYKVYIILFLLLHNVYTRYHLLLKFILWYLWTNKKTAGENINKYSKSNLRCPSIRSFPDWEVRMI